MAGKYHVIRSVSLPTATSHPTSIRVEQELNNLKLQQQQATSTITSASLCSDLSGLEQLCNCVDELLAIPTTEATLSTHRSEHWVDDLLFDASVKILDVCGTSRDTVLEVKRHVQDLQSALRRRKGNSSIETGISSYKCLRKRMERDATKMIAALKRVDTKLRASAANSQDIGCSRLIKVVTETTTIAISIFVSLLSFLGALSSSLKETKWSFVPRLMNKKVAACDSEILNEFVYADAALIKCSSSEVNRDALERLATLETSLGGLEKCLGNMFRCLVRSRVCLLNMMSH